MNQYSIYQSFINGTIINPAFNDSMINQKNEYDKKN